jgi:hypothetical protein
MPKFRMRHAILLISCLIAIKGAECRTACSFLEYAGGIYKAGKCLCYDSYKLSDLLLPKRSKALPKASQEASSDYDSLPSYSEE